jgi:hypothetical protein
MLTPRDIAIMRFICTYYVVTREMVRLAVMPETDRDGRAARKVLARLVEGGWIAKTAMLVVNPSDGAPARVFFPTRKGAEFLAVELRDDSWMHTCTQTPNWQHLHHWINCSKLHILFDQAAKLHPEVKVTGYLHEWAIANPDEKEPHKRFRLFTEIRKEPRLVSAPDSAFLLEFKTFRKVYYVEVDRGTTGINAIAASKTPGYAEQEKQGLHKRHYPTTTFDTFSVLQVSTNANRRDALRRAITEKGGSHLWRFVAWPEITVETLLHGDLIYDCQKGPYPLVKKPEGGAK